MSLLDLLTIEIILAYLTSLALILMGFLNPELFCGLALFYNFEYVLIAEI